MKRDSSIYKQYGIWSQTVETQLTHEVVVQLPREYGWPWRASTCRLGGLIKKHGSYDLPVKGNNCSHSMRVITLPKQTDNFAEGCFLFEKGRRNLTKGSFLQSTPQNLDRV